MITLKTFKKALPIFLLLGGIITTYYSTINFVKSPLIQRVEGASTITDALAYQELPADIVVHKATDAQATVILIPQVHMYPGTSADDQTNNTAYAVQQDIYTIAKAIHQKWDVNFMMVEGDMFGPIPEAKRESVKKTAGERAQMLRGAILKLQLEEPSLQVLGAENPETYKKGVRLVEEYQSLQHADATAMPAGMLDMLRAKNKDKIERVIVAQRNRETAENMVRGLADAGLTTGILQYGNGHTEGLTKELLAKGVSVVVVTPRSIAKRSDVSASDRSDLSTKSN